MEEKKLVPKMVFKEFKSTSLWKMYKLGQLIDYQHNGQTPSRFNELYWNGSINWLTSGELNRKRVYETMEKITEAGKLNANLKLIPKGTFIMAITGLEAVGTRGNCAMLGIDTTLNQSCMAIIPDRKHLDSQFLFYWYCKVGEKYGLQYTQGTKQQSYNAELIKVLPITIPEIEEQQKIGEFFKVLDERITNQERKIAKVKDLKSAYLTEMFPQEGETVPKRRFKGFVDEWNETTLDNVLAYEQPTDYIVDEDSYDDSYDIPVLTAGQSFILGYTNEKHGIKKADVDNSVIIFDDFTTSSHHVDFFFKVKSSALKILSSNSRKFTTYFAYLILNNIDYIPESHERHWISIFSNFEVMIPSMEEQQKIGEFFKNLDNQIEMEEKKLDKLQKMKEAYLEEMFV